MDVFVILVGIAGTVGGLTGILMYFETKRSADASVKSSEASGQSAAAAVASVEEAKKAGELMREERDRALERSDVEWRMVRKPAAPGILVFRNIGGTTAFAVKAVVHVESTTRFDLDPGDIEPDGTFECNAEVMAHEIALKKQQATTNMAEGGITYVPSYKMKVVARLSWTSELGSPSKDWLEADLSVI